MYMIFVMFIVIMGEIADGALPWLPLLTARTRERLFIDDNHCLTFKHKRYQKEYRGLDLPPSGF